MSVINSIPLIAAGDDGYQISRSVRLRSSASAYFNRTPASATNRKTWTWSGWVKRGSLSSTQVLFQSYWANVSWFLFEFESNNTLQVSFTAGSAAGSYTTAVFRDPSAWYHIVLKVDTTQATASNRVMLYVNGTLQTFSSTNYPAQNFDTQVNNNVAHTMGGYTSSGFYDGYMTEVNFVDGQALTPSSFGETNAVTGVWQPKKYGGTYGTNGFYLNFSDNSNNTAATIGKDYSGNGNNWTPNNISVTAGVTYDSMLDVPTPYADGGNGRGNYAVMNPLDINGMTITQGNLSAASTGATWKSTRSSISMSSGKWYCEITVTGGNTPIDCQLGVGSASLAIGSFGEWSNANPSVIYSAGDGTKWVNGTNSAYGATYTTNDVIGVAFDADALTITFYKNGTSQGTITTGWSAGTYAFELALYGRGGGTTSAVANFGQRPFSYTPPTGFVALNTQNLPEPTISNGAGYMAATTYAGNNGTQSVNNAVNNASFQPDFVWVKNRTNAFTHLLYDSVRGVGTLKAISSSEITAEGGMSDNSTFGYLSALNSNGFTVVSGSTANSYTNSSSNNYIGWQWNAGGSTVTNTSGSISAEVRANPTAGFSVVTYTGNGTQPSTVGHGLGVAPSMVIVKTRNSALYDWNSYHISLGNTQYIALNTTAAASSAVSLWNNTTPTSTVFTVNHVAVNTSSNTYVAYCFAAVAGYSAFGKYTGNGSADGPFVFTGFRPRFVMIKGSSDADRAWVMLDTSRNTANVMNLNLYANASTAEATVTRADVLSNGFKVRATGTWVNNNASTYIYMAFAENPFKNSLAR